MEERLIVQVKRIYHDTKQAINECNFLSKEELDQILLTPNEEELILNVNGSKVSLIKAATLLRELHARFLRTFVLSAFDLTWDMITTPKRFEYAKQKEFELFNSLMNVANSKQDEINCMIKDVINSIKSKIRKTFGFYKSEEEMSSNSTDSMENISTRNELQLYRQEIQECVLQMLNASIASNLVGSVESLKNSYVGTLERCLTNLEVNCCDNHNIIINHTNHHINNNSNNNNINHHHNSTQALSALKEILNAAYRVEVSVQSSILRVLWEKMKQLLSLPVWNNYGCIIDEQWKRQQALDILDSLSESRLAKSICSQFKARLKISHEQFVQSIKELELKHAGRLQHTEELRLRLRKMHAPRMAKFALESTSLIDIILYGMPCLEKEIGRGQYGVVYGCESWAGHSPCAVKSVVPPDDKHWYDLAMEFYFTRCIPEHERIVSIYGSVIDHSYGSGSTPAVLLVMQRLDRDLYSAIKSGLDWLSRLQVAIDVVEGIRFLHNQGLVHRDIKLKNILLDSNNRAKITDLGFCKPEAMMSGSVVGTPIHMSPELFSGRYDNSVDVYAFGILFWYICAGHVRLPHIFEQCQTRDQLWNCVRRGVRPERLPQFDNECWQLMVACWEGDRSKRPHLGDVEIQLRQIHARYT